MENKRYLQKDAAYYESAMMQANSIGIFNQITSLEEFQIQIIWCRYIHYCKQSRIPPNTTTHSHSFFELHCVLNGTFEYQEPDKESCRIEAGQFLLIAPQNYHYFKPLASDSETFALAFEPICNDSEEGRRIKAQLDVLSSIHMAFPKEVSQLIELIMGEFHERKPYCVYEVKSYLPVLITSLLRTIFPSNQPVGSVTHPYDLRLDILDQYISDHQNQALSVTDIAKYLDISPRQLRNIIQTNYSISVKQYLDLCKAKQARKLLLETEFSLMEISEMLGFSEHNNFNRFFRRMEGMPPGLFRLSKGNFLDKKAEKNKSGKQPPK